MYKYKEGYFVSCFVGYSVWSFWMIFHLQVRVYSILYSLCYCFRAGLVFIWWLTNHIFIFLQWSVRHHNSRAASKCMSGYFWVIRALASRYCLFESIRLFRVVPIRLELSWNRQWFRYYCKLPVKLVDGLVGHIYKMSCPIFCGRLL